MCVMCYSKETQYRLPYRDIVKFDLHDAGHTSSGKLSADPPTRSSSTSLAGVGRQTYRSDGCVGEPVFVPRKPFPHSVTQGDEDDGWVLVQLYNVKSRCTEFLILDAKHVSSGPIARIKLKHHVPAGFHGTFAEHVFIRPPPTYADGAMVAANASSTSSSPLSSPSAASDGVKTASPSSPSARVLSPSRAGTPTGPQAQRSAYRRTVQYNSRDDSTTVSTVSSTTVLNSDGSANSAWSSSSRTGSQRPDNTGDMCALADLTVAHIAVILSRL